MGLKEIEKGPDGQVSAAVQDSGASVSGNGQSQAVEQTEASGVKINTAAVQSAVQSAVQKPGDGDGQSADGERFNGKTDQELIDWLRGKIAEHVKSKEDLQKERRRRRAEGIVAGIADATQSIANLIATHNYAPNMYDASQGMSAKARARFEREKAEREAEDKEMLEYALKLRDLRSKAEDTAYQRGRDEKSDDMKQQELDMKQQWNEWRIEDGRIDNEIQQKKYEIAALTGDAKIRANEELAKLYEARAALYNRTPKMGRGGGNSGKVGEYPWYDSDGNIHYAKSYEAMRQNALQNGTWVEATEKSTTTKKKGTSTTTRPSKGHSEKTTRKHADL